MMERQATVLIVDDEPDNFDVIEILLAREGYQFKYASNGTDAMDQLPEIQPDVILLDVMMPGLDGMEVCRQIKSSAEWHHVPIIMVTALNSKEDLARCLDAGADDFVGKPMNGLELRARVRSLLRVKHQYDDLKLSLQLREDMVNMIVHDLRNPLSSIVLACDILRLTGPTEKQQKRIDQIMIAGHQLQSLIDSLLIMAKLESGRVELNKVEVDLRQIILAAVADFEPISTQKKIQLVGNLPEASGFVLLDAPIFRRVLDNLVANAIKFSPGGTQVTVQAEYLPNSGARIQVIDGGPGVSEELRQRIFEKFEVGTLLQGVAQTGLGLAFCKMAIEAHNGKISVENNTPRGAIFTVEI